MIWDRQETRQLAVKVYDWGAGLMGHSAYEECEDFEDYADEKAGDDEGDEVADDYMPF